MVLISDWISLGMVTTAPLSKPECVDAVLGLLETLQTTTPTHESILGSNRRATYDPVAVRRKMETARIADLQSRRSPKCDIAFSTSNRVRIHDFSVRYAPRVSREAFPQIWADAAALVEFAKPEFAYFDVDFKDLNAEERQGYGEGTRVKGSILLSRGIPNLFARTWFGPHVAELVGRARLEQIGPCHDTTWGGVRVDLVDGDPWLATFEDLQRAREFGMTVLADAGLVGDFSKTVAVAGPNWKPNPNWFAREE